jgi:hypothetical protein
LFAPDAESIENSATYSRNRRALAGPYLPLRDALRKEHLESRYGFDAATRGKLQKLGFHRTIN